MKKILFSAAIFLSGMVAVNAQEGNFKIGANIGVPVGKLADTYSFNLGLDIAYLWKVNDIIDLGATTGISNYFGKNISGSYMGYNYDFDIEDAQIIPLAATAKFTVAKNFFIGTDLGYAFFIDDEADTGAFYFQPKAGFDLKKSELYLSYKGMTIHEMNIGSINLGYAYNF